MKVSDEVIYSFLKTLEKESLTARDFYIQFTDYLSENKIEYRESELEIDTRAFNIAKENGYIGYKEIYTIHNPFTFCEDLTKYIKKAGYYYFYFNIENEDEKNLSFTQIWKKWDDEPSGGWLGGWCACGSFFPYTLDFNAMNIDTNKSDYEFRHKPRAFKTEDIDKIVFCSDSYIRFFLKDGVVIRAKPFKEDRGLTYIFSPDLFKNI